MSRPVANCRQHGPQPPQVLRRRHDHRPPPRSCSPSQAPSSSVAVAIILLALQAGFGLGFKPVAPGSGQPLGGQKLRLVPARSPVSRASIKLRVVDDQINADGATVGAAADSAIDVEELLTLAGKSAWSKGPVPYSQICLGVAKETKQDEKRVAQVGLGANHLCTTSLSLPTPQPQRPRCRCRDHCRRHPSSPPPPYHHHPTPPQPTPSISYRRHPR